MSAAKANASALPVDDKRRAHEPTMEEILASIRRIISDDQSARAEVIGSEPEEPLDPEPTPAIGGGQGELNQLHATGDRQENILRQLRASSEAQSRGAFRQAAEILEAAERELIPPETSGADISGMPGNHPDAPDIEQLSPLVSATTAATIAAQFESLAASRLFGDDGRMDDLVKQLLRPMLQEWLEDNLPGIVEKLVRAEIERVARGGSH